MARLDIPRRFVSAVYIRRISNGTTRFVREPYNIVALDFGDGTPVNTYVEFNTGCPRSPQTEREEVYDDIRYYDSPPFPMTRIGYGAPGQ